MTIYLLLAIIIGYLVFVAIRIGLHQRLPLALGPISLELIPDRAAKKYGESPLFTIDKPCHWEIEALKPRYNDPLAWSAKRIQSTAGMLASLLQHQFNLQYGERVAIFKQNHFDIHLFTMSIIRAGGIACPVNGKLTINDFEPYLANLSATILITDSAAIFRFLQGSMNFGCCRKLIIAEKRALNSETESTALEEQMARRYPDIQLYWLEEAILSVHKESPAVPRGKDDPLYLVHSSGTTGFPKAVILKNGPQAHAVRGWLCYVHLSRTWDKGFGAVPNNHQAVILSFNSLLLLGFPVHWSSSYDHQDFNAEEVMRTLAAGKFTGYFGFPVTYTQLKEVPTEKYDLSAMRIWGSTADASHEVIQRKFVSIGNAFKAFGIPLKGSIYLDAQGSSEVGTPSVIRYITRYTNTFDRRIGRIGSTPFGPKIRIVKENGEKVKRGEVGKLEVKGKTVFAGYWNNHALTYEAIHDNWFFTGDVVRLNKDGHLIQLDRLVDVIHTSNGEVYSLPIEEKLHKHPAVYDICVYAHLQPDGTYLPAVAAALKVKNSIDNNLLLHEFNQMLEEKEKLCRCEIMEWSEFPIGVTGKTLKRVFRNRSEQMTN
ncbi:ANL family adenylate-forming protein [Sabulibacter ruber]|uniref:ANL family adenylate-forming protein n=1 Tax=Sabulibacter ruber TaxID=2811901 RepID=UPI001A97AED3|nr:class I adenylate-forming enzyme family protein [Sabulibacter ruber]